MTPIERARLTDEWFRDHQADWDAYLARPWQDRAADQDKVQQAIDQGGPIVGRRMAAALGMPSLPDELCDPVEVLEARCNDGGAWIREMAQQLGLSAVEVEELMQPMVGRVDH